MITSSTWRVSFLLSHSYWYTFFPFLPLFHEITQKAFGAHSGHRKFEEKKMCLLNQNDCLMKFFLLDLFAGFEGSCAQSQKIFITTCGKIQEKSISAHGTESRFTPSVHAFYIYFKDFVIIFFNFDTQHIISFVCCVY